MKRQAIRVSYDLDNFYTVDYLNKKYELIILYCATNCAWMKEGGINCGAITNSAVPPIQLKDNIHKKRAGLTCSIYPN